MAVEKLVRTNLSFKRQAVNRRSRHSRGSELLVGRKSVGRQLPTADRELANWQAGKSGWAQAAARAKHAFRTNSSSRRRAPSYPRASCVYMYVQICASAPPSNDGITTLTT